MQTLRGKAAAAERATIRPLIPDQAATMAAWLIDAPGQSPAWRHFLLVLIHLRDVPDAPPATKQFPEAEHQITMFALDPQGRPTKDDPESWWPLVPFNGEVQFGGATDEQALQALDLVAWAICQGELAAEPPFTVSGREAFKRFVERLVVRVVLPRPVEPLP